MKWCQTAVSGYRDNQKLKGLTVLLPSAMPRTGLFGASGQRLRTNEAGKLAEAPGHMHGEYSAVALLQGDVAQVV